MESTSAVSSVEAKANGKGTNAFSLQEVAGDQVSMTCQYVSRVLKMLDEHPDLELGRIVPITKVSLLDLFLVLRRHSTHPHTASVLQQFKSLSEHDPRLMNYLKEATDESLSSIRSSCVETFGAEANLPVADIPDLLRAKKSELKSLEGEVMALTKEYDETTQKMNEMLKDAADQLETALRAEFPDPGSENDQEFQARLKACKTLATGDLLRLHLQWKVKFYTKEKIAELRGEFEELQAKKTELERGIADLKEKKAVYDSLGPDFKKLARSYGTMLRDREMEERILNTDTSYVVDCSDTLHGDVY